MDHKKIDLLWSISLMVISLSSLAVSITNAFDANVPDAFAIIQCIIILIATGILVYTSLKKWQKNYNANPGESNFLRGCFVNGLNQKLPSSSSLRTSPGSKAPFSPWICTGRSIGSPFCQGGRISAEGDFISMGIFLRTTET